MSFKNKKLIPVLRGKFFAYHIKLCSADSAVAVKSKITLSTPQNLIQGNLKSCGATGFLCNRLRPRGELPI